VLLDLEGQRKKDEEIPRAIIRFVNEREERLIFERFVEVF
jgi:hypothetical protein